jgi:hypothetical protein
MNSWNYSEQDLQLLFLYKLDDRYFLHLVYGDRNRTYESFRAEEYS